MNIPAVPPPPPSHLSVSQMRTWLRCNRQYGYRYVMGIKEPPSWAMRAGTAMDDTMTVHNRAKMAGGGLGVSAAQDFFRDKVREVADKEGLDKGADMAAVVDDGTKVIPVYFKELDPAIVPLAVQKEIKTDVGGVPMLGYIDLVRDAKGHRIVSDYKFTSRAPSAGAAAASMQLAHYADAEGDPSGHVDLIALVRTKTPKIVTDSHFVTEENKAGVRRMVRQVAAGIASKRYPLASSENEWGNGPSSFCNPTRCGYHSICKGSKTGPMPIPGEVEV